MSERYVRMCPEHRRILEELSDLSLRCSAGEGGHIVTEHCTFDRVKGAVVDAGKGWGEEKAVRTRPIEKAPTAPSAWPPPAKKLGKGGTLEHAKFIDEAGAVLWIRLERKKSAYICRWQRSENGQKNAQRTSGGLSIDSEEAPARRAFEAACKEALTNDWKQQPIIWGQQVKLLPLPKANIGLGVRRGPGRPRKRAA